MEREPVIANTLTVGDVRTITAQLNSHVRVVEGGTLIQHGQINGDVLVEIGGLLEQHGQVNGTIDGYGSVRVWGQINGEVRAHPDSDVMIAQGVMVGPPGRQRFVADDGTFQPVPRKASFTTSVGPKMWRLSPEGHLSPV